MLNEDLFIINKKIGQTPLQALEILRKKEKLPKGYKLTYAGRLDPMAEGVLLVLGGEKTRQKDKYLKLDKKYEAKVLFGIGTDTFDVLGKIISINTDEPKSFYFSIFKSLNKRTPKSLNLIIPPYSSVPVDGKPSFTLARKGELNEANAVKRNMGYYKITFGKSSTISSLKLLPNVLKRISKVKGDFRQKEIIKIWEQKLLKLDKKFPILDISIHSKSGFYVRSFAHYLGTLSGMGAILYKLKRTAVGKHVL